MYLIGDNKQLPPVVDAEFFTPLQRLKGVSVGGEYLFDAVQQCFVLSVSQRQCGDHQSYCDILDHSSNKIIRTRPCEYVDQTDVTDYATKWDEVLRLLLHTASVLKYNEFKLWSLDVPIARIQGNPTRQL